MNQKNKNCCDNCAHYVQHYIKTTASRISPICDGHCLDHYLSMKEQRAVPFIYDCPAWQPKEIADKEKMQSIRKSMQIIAHRLDEIALFLKDEIDKV